MHPLVLHGLLANAFQRYSRISNQLSKNNDTFLSQSLSNRPSHLIFCHLICLAHQFRHSCISSKHSCFTASTIVYKEVFAGAVEHNTASWHQWDAKHSTREMGWKTHTQSLLTFFQHSMPEHPVTTHKKIWNMNLPVCHLCLKLTDWPTRCVQSKPHALAICQKTPKSILHTDLTGQFIQGCLANSYLPHKYLRKVTESNIRWWKQFFSLDPCLVCLTYMVELTIIAQFAIARNISTWSD